jgi:hypothetical protein
MTIVIGASRPPSQGVACRLGSFIIKAASSKRLTGSKGGFQFLHTDEEIVPLSAQGIDMPGKAAELVLLSLKL